MFFAQVGMGIDIVGPMFVLWLTGCGMALATIAITLLVFAPKRLALLLGLGIGACLMSIASLIVGARLGFTLDVLGWKIIPPLLSLAIGILSIWRGRKAYPR